MGLCGGLSDLWILNRPNTAPGWKMRTENVLQSLNTRNLNPGVVNITHTEVDPSMGGQGIAGKITEHVANLLRADGRKAELSCSYAIKWFQKHPEYSDVLADSEKEAEKAKNLVGPACGIKRP